jgi:hypothetical protein
MLWLKRNLVLVIAILVGVALTVGGGFYVWNKKNLNDDLTQKLGQARQELNRLTSDVKPSPTLDNVRAARDDVKKSQEYSAQCRKYFVPTPFQPLNSQSYRSMLETNLAELRRAAAAARVELATNYNFSFEPEIRPMTFEPASIRPLSEQLTEVSEVCRALFKGRIHSLAQIRRVAVSQHDTPSSTEILQGTTISSNRFAGLTIWPYEFTFDCFSTQLAAALEEISRIQRMVLIKTLTVESGPTTVALATAPPPPGGALGPSIVTGPGGRRILRPAELAVAPVSPTGLTTVLDESLLRVVMVVHVIKPPK